MDLGWMSAVVTAFLAGITCFFAVLFFAVLTVAIWYRNRHGSIPDKLLPLFIGNRLALALSALGFVAVASIVANQY